MAFMMTDAHVQSINMKRDYYYSFECRLFCACCRTTVLKEKRRKISKSKEFQTRYAQRGRYLKGFLQRISNGALVETRRAHSLNMYYIVRQEKMQKTSSISSAILYLCPQT